MKKILSVFLAAVLFVTAFLSYTALAYNDETTPIVYVEGFGRCTLTKDLGKDSEIDAYIPSWKIFAKALLDFAPYFAQYKKDGDYDKLGDGLIALLDDAVEYLRCDDEGNSVYDISVKPANTVTGENYYGYMNDFNYDWRKDVTETADDLNDYINLVLEKTGKSKVCLICESMGGCIGASYLVKYGYSKVSSVIMSSAAVNGVKVFNDILMGDMELKPEYLYDYLCAFELFRDIDITKSLIYGFNEYGGFEALLKNICEAVKICTPRLYEDFAYKTAAKMPGIWAFAFEEDFEEGKEKAGIEKGSALENKINKYHYDIKPYIHDTLENAMRDGVKLAIISGYNLRCTPVTKDDTYQSDYLIGTKETSFGAYCAPLGGTLGDNYTQKINDGKNRISPDNIIDVSTCVFPDNTWLVKNLTHTRKDVDFFCWVAYTDGEVNVEANEAYPQFMKYKNPHYLAMDETNCDTEGWFFKLMKTILAIIMHFAPGKIEL